MAKSFCAVSERWAFEIGRSQRGHPGRTDVRRGSSDRSGGTALTMSLCLANGTFVICSTHIKNTTNEARTHLSLHKDAPIPRAAQTVGHTLAVPILGGLHHHYIRREFPTGTTYFRRRVFWCILATVVILMTHAPCVERL